MAPWPCMAHAFLRRCIKSSTQQHSSHRSSGRWSRRRRYCTRSTARYLLVNGIWENTYKLNSFVYKCVNWKDLLSARFVVKENRWNIYIFHLHGFRFVKSANDRLRRLPHGAHRRHCNLCASKMPIAFPLILMVVIKLNRRRIGWREKAILNRIDGLFQLQSTERSRIVHINAI